MEKAFKYTKVRVGCVTRASGASVAIETTDDELGLRLDEIERVLRPSQRLDEATPGHGFGLPIARELVELYGGTLALRADVWALTVRLTLPRVG